MLVMGKKLEIESFIQKGRQADNLARITVFQRVILEEASLVWLNLPVQVLCAT